MNLAEPFIRRPVMTTLVMASILVAGVMGYRLLPVNDLPNVDFPTLQVSAGLPGANPETMASAVATTLERQFSTIAGLDNMTSSNTQGGTQITLQFSLDRDIDAAAQDVQAAISQAARQLPEDMPSPPSFRKVNPADSPILLLALSSPVLPLSTVNEYAENFIGQRISMVSGVAQVQVYGSQKYAVRVQLDPDALAARGIGIDEVADAVRNGNVNLPTGNLQGSHQAFTVQANGQLTTAADYRPLIVAYRNGVPVRLAELGRVQDSVENDKAAAWFNEPSHSTRAVVLAVQRQPGTNTVQVVDAIKRLLPTFRSQLPAAVELNLLFDRSESIRASVHDVKFTLLLTVGLVILVIFLFLRSLSATVIPSLALPMSIVGTFSVMYLLDFSVNNISLMALTLSVGFVVDDAIVMLENIVRHREMGKSAWAAALEGSHEVGFTILSMTLSLAAVFLPVLFMGGILGRILHEFAVTIGVAILISGFVSLTLTPMLCSRFLREPGTVHHGHLYALSERFFAGMLAAYRWSLLLAMRHRPAMMLLLAGLFYGTFHLFAVMPKGFLPSEDTGQLFISTEAAQGISFQDMVRHQQALTEIVRQDPNVAAFMSSAGSGGPAGSSGNNGRMFIRLAPRGERKLSADDVAQALRSKLAVVPGINAFAQVPPTIRLGGRVTKSLYQYTLQSPNMDELYAAVPRLEARLRQLPGLQDVASDLQITNPQAEVAINRDKAAALGVSARRIEDALFTAYGARQISTFYLPNDAYRVVMELLPQYQASPAVLSKLYVRADRGGLVPLATLADVRRDVGPLSINHLGQLPAVTLSFNLVPGTALGDAVAAVSKAADEVLPKTVSGSFQGTAQAFASSVSGLGLLLLMAVLVIYIVLGILYESFIHPLTILSGLPAAGVGALVTLLFFHMELDLYGFVGIIMLVGIVKKNAIMMIDFALEAQRKEGKSPAEAIVQGCLIRFRPIMMTTMAALMGSLPIALGLGSGAEARRPLGVAIVGGLVFSQFLTLYITPVIYTYMEKLRHLGRRQVPASQPVHEAEILPAG